MISDKNRLKRTRGIIVILLVATLIFTGCNAKVDSPSEARQDVKTLLPVETIEHTAGPDDTPMISDAPEPDIIGNKPSDEPYQSPGLIPEPVISPAPTAKPTDTPTPKPTKKPTSSHTQTTTSAPAPLTPLDVDIVFLEQVKDKIVELCNVERAKAGLHSLVPNTKLNEIAQHKSEEMGLYNYFKHDSIVTHYKPCELASKVFGYKYKTYGENIWMKNADTRGDPKDYLDTFTANITAKEIVDGWMNSKGHRENILNVNFNKIGVGVVVCSDLRAYATQVFSD